MTPLKVVKGLLASLLIVTSAARADYTMIIPQEPGGGTSVWASIVAKELEKKLGERIVLQHIPGARDIPGANKFANELYKDPKTIMVAHGGNAESFLLEQVDYDYKKWDPIGLMNLTIVVGKRTDTTKIKFAAGSGNNPDMMAVTLLECGPQPSMDAYLACYRDKIVYVPGMSGSERRLAFKRGELNTTRETPAAYIKHVMPLVEQGVVTTWFDHGIVDLKTGKLVDDPNFPNMLFADVYKKRWGVAPSGPLFDSYMLVKNYRDVLQKSLWVGKGNPNSNKLRQALRDMINDPDSRSAIEKDAGKYGWFVGAEVNQAMKFLDGYTTKKALKDLVWWSHNAFNTVAVYKDELAHK